MSIICDARVDGVKMLFLYSSLKEKNIYQALGINFREGPFKISKFKIAFFRIGEGHSLCVLDLPVKSNNWQGSHIYHIINCIQYRTDIAA